MSPAGFEPSPCLFELEVTVFLAIQAKSLKLENISTTVFLMTAALPTELHPDEPGWMESNHRHAVPCMKYPISSHQA